MRAKCRQALCGQALCRHAFTFCRTRLCEYCVVCTFSMTSGRAPNCSNTNTCRHSLIVSPSTAGFPFDCTQLRAADGTHVCFRRSQALQAILIPTCDARQPVRLVSHNLSLRPQGVAQEATKVDDAHSAFRNPDHQVAVVSCGVVSEDGSKITFAPLSCALSSLVSFPLSSDYPSSRGRPRVNKTTSARHTSWLP